jgi:hypothetical protein
MTTELRKPNQKGFVVGFQYTGEREREFFLRTKNLGRFVVTCSHFVVRAFDYRKTQPLPGVWKTDYTICAG